MAGTLVRELLDAGVHFGHRCSRWNPKMKPYIYGKRNEIHIIDIRETLRGMLRAKKLLARVVGSGGDVLFVGTKRQAREIVQEESLRCKMHYVCERWLGGTLTNFRTIRSRLQRLEELEVLAASPEWESGYSKKMKSMLSRELKKIRTNLQGVRNMSRIPGVVVLIDVRKEMNAVREAEALGIPTIALIDTDGDPDRISVVIPGNDDAIRSVHVVIHYLADAVEEALRARPEPRPQEEAREITDYGAPPPRRRPRRPGMDRPGHGERMAAPGVSALPASPPEPAQTEPVSMDSGPQPAAPDSPPGDSASDAGAGGAGPVAPA